MTLVPASLCLYVGVQIHSPLLVSVPSSVGGVVFSSDVSFALLLLSELVLFFALALAFGFANLALFSR